MATPGAKCSVRGTGVSVSAWERGWSEVDCSNCHWVRSTKMKATAMVRMKNPIHRGFRAVRSKEVSSCVGFGDLDFDVLQVFELGVFGVCHVTARGTSDVVSAVGVGG